MTADGINSIIVDINDDTLLLPTFEVIIMILKLNDRFC